MPRRKCLNPKEDAKLWVDKGKDKDGLNVMFISAFKGRGVFTGAPFEKGDFVLEYRGELVTKQECERRQQVYQDKLKVFMFEFRFDGKFWCIDAAKEDESLGRLVNDDHRNPNTKMRYLTVKGQPHLCLFATRDINPGEEITYNYGDSDWPWRDKQPDTEMPTRASQAGDHEQFTVERGDSSMSMSQSELSPVLEPQPNSGKQPDTEIPTRASQAGDHEQFTVERGDSSMSMNQSELSPVLEPQPNSGKQPDTEIPTRASQAGDHEQCPGHRLEFETMSALDKCLHCLGPVSSLKWIGYKCKVCAGIWHLSCYYRLTNKDDTSDLDQLYSSGEEYVPESQSDNSDISMPLVPHQSKAQLSQGTTALPSNYTSLHADHMDVTGTETSDSTAVGVDDTAGETSDTANSKKDSPNEQVKNKQKKPPTHLSLTSRNYCFICGKPQSRLTRHLKTHMLHPEVSYAFYLSENSKERKVLFEKMRNKGNFQHNHTILGGQNGQLKVKRKPKATAVAGDFVHCMHCKGLFARKELWRHVRRCPCRPENEAQDNQTGRTRVLALAAAQETVFSQQFSSGMWKILGTMKLDEVGLAVRNDLSIVNFAQSLYNRHGQDPTKHEYMRQKLREVGRLLVCLRTDFSIHSLEEAIKPSNFQVVVQAVKKVAGFDEETFSYHTPSLALKLGHTLQRICDHIHCRALMAEDEGLMKSATMFSKLYTSKWCELVSHSALSTLSSAKYNKPTTLPFTEDVRTLHQYLQKTVVGAVGNLMEEATSKNYAELAKAALAQIIIFNRRRAGEVSKMLLRSFAERDRSELHQDVAMGLSKVEQRLCSYFARVEIVGKRGRKVVVLLTPCMVDALSLLTSKRKECGVRDENVFLFGRPQALSYYRGQDCLRVYASQCGAKHPELLRSTQLRKHVATLSQILNLKNNELDQVADFLGHDIRVHREFYRLPVPTTQLAKISKLLLSMEKGDLSGLQGRSLDEIEIGDEISLSDTEAKDSDSDSEDNSTEAKGPKDEEGLGLSSGCTDMEQAHSSVNHGKHAGQEPEPKRRPKKMWSKAEVAAVMRHFGDHISKGKLASKNECNQCMEAEDPVLSERTVQNIRDFVRNRITTAKRKTL